MVALPAVPTVPVRIHVPLAAGVVTVPLATPGPLEATTYRIYALLGIQTQLVRADDGQDYTVPLAHIVLAINAIRGSLNGGVPLAGQTCQVPVANVAVPYWQPQVDGEMSELLAALGVDVVNLVFPGGVYTAPLAHVGCANAHFNAPAIPAVPGAAPAAPAPVPRMTQPVVGVTLQDFYRGAPSRAIQVLARLFGARFMRIQDADGNLVWVLAGQPATDATIQRLGLLA